MALPLLKYAPTTQNSRVKALRVGSDEDPKAVAMDKAMDREDQNFVIEAAYRQIFFHAFKVDRDRTLESQVRNGQITVRDFIRSLCLSDTFTRSFYNLNSNYRVARHLVEKLLGRPRHQGRCRRHPQQPGVSRQLRLRHRSLPPQSGGGLP